MTRVDLDHSQTDRRSIVTETIDKFAAELREINLSLHDHPETAFQEFFAHDTIAKFFEGLGFDVHRSVYGLATSFEVEFGTGGSVVVLCAEYDALPGIGHGCGHNLIATSSIAAFLAATEVLKRSRRPGRIRLLGTPAEEAGGGKARLLDAGAFPSNTAAAIMAHPMCARQIFYDTTQGYHGLAALKFIATHLFKTEFRGKSAHAGAEPWNGVNALDAAVSAYNNVSLLRQHIHPDDRVHAVMEVGGTVPNVIPEYTRDELDGAKPNDRKSESAPRARKGMYPGGCFRNWMRPHLSRQEKAMNASTDMGNVAHRFPTFHGAFIVPAGAEVTLHSSDFAQAAGTEAAHTTALQTAKGMAMLAVRVLLDADIAQNAMSDFQDRHDW
ncbi:hypothetical protein NPX13_g481 [Xylaria arbuscula]|uniref:Peptidase M20 domain-containing protein 2 n=1 Tax=Xylaria arbuscula TaxID=114810 RepID=A0A9W8NNV4_9PEZI|nr:hypothetical protein NPX13_g481 [Xylaria arbuscula]